MAARITRELYLQVGGNVTGVQTASKAGKSALLDIGNAAVDVQAVVEKAFAEMAANGPASAKALENSYTKTFNAIRSNAKAVLEAPSSGAALQILDAGAAERSAQAAETQAAALRQVATAAASVAQRAGEAGDAERVLAVAAAANATQAEQEAVALRNQANVLGLVRGELTSMGVVQKNAVAVTGQHRQSMVMAGQQAQDFFVQIGSGQSVVTAFVQQIGQLGFAVQGMGGRMESVANFLTGPWGIGTMIAVTALTPLIAKVLEHSDALKDETDKLKDNAEKAAIADQAKQAFMHTTAGAIEDVRLLTEEIKKQNDALLTNAERLNIRSKQRLETLADRRGDVSIELDKARAALRAANAGGVGGVAGSGSMIQGQAADKVRELEDTLKAVDKAIADANAARLATQKDLADEAAKRAIDPLEQIKRAYEGPDGLIALAKKNATQEEVTNGVLTRRLSALREEQRLKTQAEQKRQSDAKRTGSSSAESSVGDMTALLKAVLPGVRITSTTGGKHTAGSDHYKDRAIDFVPAGGMGSITKAQVREMLVGAGVRIRRNGAGVEQLFGPGDKGHSDHFHVAWEGGVKSTDELAKARETRERAAEAAAMKRDRDQEAYAQLLLRGAEEQVALRRAQTIDIAAAADLDVQAVGIERERLDSAAQAGVTQKRWTQAQADALKQIHASNAQAKTTAIRDRQSQQLLDQQLQADSDALSASSTLLQLQGDLAVTMDDRKRIALQMLANDEAQQRARAIRLIGSQDPKDWAKGESMLRQIDAEHGPRTEIINRQDAGPLERYRQQLKAATDDTNAALEDIAVHGFGSIEDGAASATGQAITNLLRLKGVAGQVVSQIITDLARLALQKTILSFLPGVGSFLGFATGGKVEGKATGGKIRGPGTGTSDSILALIDGAKPLMVSNGESIVTADATARWWPIIDAMNKGTLKWPGLATGGAIGTVRMPRLPDIGEARRAVDAANDNRARAGVTIPITIDARGADPASVARMDQSLADLRRELPGIVVSTYTEAKTRGVIV
ncbi:hypothetical protein [Sphingomonas aquatilis]|uniref:hypothetical protein n=1 Tax=Sphingomonas aquatilis TaxID=93063 RepID=UPI0023F65B90|nr:hypothetical protein [Sphingomonas aquatilis]MCI4653129.1 hypothetical protein [Sphingomonas aquatilis]